MKVVKVYLFKGFEGFERFWHWAQASLVIFMIFTGFEIHGIYHVFGFERVADLHTTAAWVLIYLWIFGIFWHFTTGEWKQYIPTSEKLLAMSKFYLVGIMKHEEHPFRPTSGTKLNPLQKLSYLVVKVVLGPFIWVSGLLYMFYNDWISWGIGGLLSLDMVALILFVGVIITVPMFALLGTAIYAVMVDRPGAYVGVLVTIIIILVFWAITWGAFWMVSSMKDKNLLQSTVVNRLDELERENKELHSRLANLADDG